MLPARQTPRRVSLYKDDRERLPFGTWLKTLDGSLSSRILSKIKQVGEGNFGDCKAVKDGVYELRIKAGPGLRVYFGLDGETLVILLGGGDKSRQSRDIAAAKQRWRDYLSDPEESRDP